MKNSKRIIEINGVRLEVDLSTARRIKEFKIGDNVKVLRKEYSGYKVEPGVITELINFEQQPTIVIACFKAESCSAPPCIEFIYYTSETRGVEIAPCREHELKLEKNKMVDKFKREIEKKREEADTLEAKLDYFLGHFQQHFEGE